VLEAKTMFEAALHYAKLTSAANETHADCLRMIVRAEMRMADEIDRGQQRGDVAAKGQDPGNVRTPDISTLDQLGVDRRRVAEWRDVRDAGEHVVEQAIESALAEGRAPTKADIKRAVEGKPHVSHNSGDNEWYTPEPYIVAARKVLGAIDLDPASSAEANAVVKAKRYFSADDDGLTREWSGAVWMNPPYAQPLVAQFCEKLADSVADKSVTAAIVLVNNATETQWFRDIAQLANAVCFPNGRVRFWSPGKESAAPLQGQALLYIGPKTATFVTVFSQFGLCWVKS
jgi:phage N-6-adenine-methyltransferase